MENRKVVIIGSGAVGSTTAYTMMFNESINEIVIIDINKDKAIGDALDIQHGMAFLSPKKIYAGDYKDIKDAHIIIITAGVAQKPNETRLDLLKKNLRVFDDIIKNMKPYLDEAAIVLVVTNPVDILSYFTYLKLGIDASRVIGSGTVLDTARLKAILSEDTGIDPRNIHTFVLGEHGDSEVAAWSVTTVGGMPLLDYCNTCGKCNYNNKKHLEELLDKVRGAAYEIIERKGATFYAIAISINKIVEVILNNQNSVLTVSSYIESMFDNQISNVYLSLPVVVNSKGVKNIITLNYSDEEIKQIVKSANILKSQYEVFKEFL
ncbi:TPA: L-lactate dehydrogenase [bacterium]|nr:L-lactate dehydrogenase [bacterium]